ncbi:endonuclease [Spirochaetia bacterium]|nr:endonuclease [Spirochaetia bacterium]
MKQQNKRLAALFLAPLLWALISGCNFPGAEPEESAKVQTITVMTWNMQTLFDGTDTGNEYDEYRESADWSREKYMGRLNIIAGAIGRIDPAPDVIAVQEVETAGVVEDLANSLAKRGYTWTHFANSPGMSLGVGVLSRFPLHDTKVHTITINGDTTPRPVLETRITAGDEALALFICHWKSKLGGDDLTEAVRRASARIILRRMRELAEQEPDLPVIIMGDLNENHDEFYRRNGTVISALLPDDPYTADQAGFYSETEDVEQDSSELQKDFLVISKTKPPVPKYFPPEILTLYSPWNNELKNGSYYYKNNWETIDHFLLSGQLFTKTGWEFSGCAVIDYPPFTNSNGHPVSYNPRTGSGMSDHLPLLLSLQLVSN